MQNKSISCRHDWLWKGQMQNKKQVDGWTHILGMDAQNMSQWMADHRRRVASEVGSCSLLTPPTPFTLLVMLPLFPCSFTFSLGIRCSCLPVYSLYLSIYLVPLQTGSCFFPSTSRSPPPLSLTLWLQHPVRKATSGFLKGSTYASKSPTESPWIMTEAFPLI